MQTRSGPDNRWLAALAVLGIAGLIIVVLLHDRGVPIAAIDFKVRQTEATQVAANYLNQLGFDLSGFRTAVSFETDRDAQGYVERKSGQRELDRAARDEVTVWRWSVRFFRELDPLEYYVSILPDGRVAGWQRVVAEATPGASLSEADARTLAESAALPALAAGGDRVWAPAGTVRETRPGRVDYRFTWERQGFTIGEATQRRWVLIQGSEIAGTGDFLKVPETWIRDQRIETNRGVVLATVGWTLTYGMVLAAGVYFLFEWRAGRTRKRVPAFLIGILLTVGILALINQLPVFVSGYPTTASLTGYLLGQVRDQASMLVPEIVAVAIAAAAGIPLWRRAFPNAPDPGKDLSWENIRSGRFIPALIVGYAASGIWLGYFTLFYFAGTNFFNVWSPVELPYRDVMSGAFPAAFPLFIGAAAAFTEETLFRLFALPAGFLAAVAIWTRARGAAPSPRTRTFLLAAVIVTSAVIWGSLHSTYPQQPFFIRALEVSIVGVFAGAVVFRWGIVSTIATHYIGNTAIVGMLFLLSGNRDLQIAAIVVVALPLLLLVPYLVGRFRGVTIAEPKAESAIPGPGVIPGIVALSPPESGERPGNFRLPPRVLFPIVAGLAIGAVLLGVPQASDSLTLTTTREQAVAQANLTLAQIGATHADWIVLSNFVDATRGNEATYLLRTIGPAGTTAFYDRGAPIPYPPGFWQIRFSRPLQKEEIGVLVDPDGRVLGYNRVIDEAAPGASPSPADAQKIAERILAGVTGGTDGWNLVSSSQTKRDARLDSTLVWERQGFQAGEATLRVQIGLLGDEPGSVRRFLKIPEAFVRDLSRDTGIEGLLRTARDLLSVLVVAGGGLLFLGRFRSNRVTVGSAAKITAIVAAAWLVALIAGLPSLLAGYLNTLDLAGFAIYQISLRIRDGLILFSGTFVIAAVVLDPAKAPEEDSSGLRRITSLYLNVAFGIVGAIALIAGYVLIPGIRAAAAPATLRPGGALPPIDAYLPALASIGGDLVTALTGSFGLLVLPAIFERFIRPPWLRYLLMILAAALYFGADGRGLPDITLSAAIGAASAVIALLLWLAHGRPSAGVFLAIISTLMLRDAYQLAKIGAGDAYWTLNAALMIAALVAAWFLTLRRISASGSTAESPDKLFRSPGRESPLP